MNARALRGIFTLLATIALGAAMTAANGAPEPAPLAQADPAARLPGGKSMQETWQLAALLDDGSFLLARFLVTNLGPGDRNALALGLRIGPDGAVHDFNNVRRSDEWELAPDRLRLDVGSSRLDLHTPHARYRVSKKNTQLDVQLPLDAHFGFPDSIAIRSPAGDAGEDWLATGVPIVGTMMQPPWPAPRDVRGVAWLSHAWRGHAVPEATRVITVYARSEAARLLLLHSQAPQQEARTWLALSDDQGPAQVVSAVSARAEGALAGMRAQGYPVPGRLLLGGGAEGSVSFDRLLFERDFLRSFPQPLRSLMSWGLKQRPLRVWARASIDVTLRPGSGGPPRRFHGGGAAAVAFADVFEGR